MITVENVRQDRGLDLFEEKRCAIDNVFFLNTYGKCVFWMNDRKVVMEKGDAILIPEGVQFYWKSIPTVFHSKYAVTFRKMNDSPPLPFFNSKEYIYAKLGCYDLIHERMKLISSQWNDKLPYYDILGAALMLEILTYCQRESDRGTLIPEKYNIVEIMKRYIQENYRRKITKEDLARVIRKSPNYAATLFSRTTGQTISEYVHSIRTKTAIYMLSESDLTIGEISEFLGYSDVSYFNKVFKRITGRTPSDYFNERPSIII
ncbi:helix-turn-helix domain-containing protein [Paenibacillus alkalitolerans]|uniref:helix-turn-helix domain-containing protein n=1 Tax=Paenibacillus alkalitolerans TaxID=2799335 RepID=UPI0018F74114|nr:AraC family transcriptional regulator [Paenibacillus alkalitolerans]